MDLEQKLKILVNKLSTGNFDEVIFGMLSIFLGLVGGIVIFLGVKNQKFTIMMVSGGLAMMFASLVIIYELTNHSLF